MERKEAKVSTPVWVFKAPHSPSSNSVLKPGTRQMYLNSKRLKSLFNIDSKVKRKRQRYHSGRLQTLEYSLNNRKAYSKQSNRTNQDEQRLKTAGQFKNHSQVVKSRLNFFSSMMPLVEGDLLSPREELDKSMPITTSILEKESENVTLAAKLGISLEEFESLEMGFKNFQFDFPDLTDGYQNLISASGSRKDGSMTKAAFKKIFLESDDNIDPMDLNELLQYADTNLTDPKNLKKVLDILKARKRLAVIARRMGSAPYTAPNTPNNVKPSGNSAIYRLNTGNGISTALPPLKSFPRKSSKRLSKKKGYKKYYGRKTSNCLRPGYQTDITVMRRELALSEYGLKKLDVRVKENFHWIQANCREATGRSQALNQRWGIEKLNKLKNRIDKKFLLRGWQKWIDFFAYERNKEKADWYLKCKGCKSLIDLLAKWKRNKCLKVWNLWIQEVLRQSREEYESAAVEAERVVRGYLVRQSIRQMAERTAATNVQRVVRGYLGRISTANHRRKLVQNRSVIILQRVYRKHCEKKRNKANMEAKRQQVATCTIQRFYRLNKKRKLGKLVFQHKWRQLAIIKIQCATRRYFANKIVDAKRNQRLKVFSAIKIQNSRRAQLVRRKYKKMKGDRVAAICIQSAFRGFCLRKETAVAKQQQAEIRYELLLHGSAIKIQSLWRGHTRRSAYHLIIKSIRQKVQREFWERNRAATNIQKLWRGFCGRNRYRKLNYIRLENRHRIKTEISARRIQGAWYRYRGHLAKHLLRQAAIELQEEERYASTRIQALGRGYIHRQIVLKLKNEQQRKRSYDRERKQAIISIQKILKGKIQRRKYIKLRNENRKQAKNALLRLVSQQREDAAIRIQCAARRYISKIAYYHKLKAMEEIKKRRLLEAKEQHAAIVIQCHMRKKKAHLDALKRRQAYQDRITALALKQADDTIANLKLLQQEELTKMKMQLLSEKNAAEAEAQRLRQEVEDRLKNDISIINQPQNELLELRMKGLLEKSAEDSLKSKIEERREQCKIIASREEAIRQGKREAEMINLESQTIAAANLAAVLGANEKMKREIVDQQQAIEEQRVMMLELQKTKAAIKLQLFFRHHLSRKKLKGIKDDQRKHLMTLKNEEERMAVAAQQQQQLNEERMKTLFEKNQAEALAAEHQAVLMQKDQELIAEKYRNECDVAARKIQAVGHGYLARIRARNIKEKLSREKLERQKRNNERLEMIRHGDSREESITYEEAQDDWVEYWDENAQSTYYFNVRTQEATWTRPETLSNLNGGYSASGTTTDHYEYSDQYSSSYYNDQYNNGTTGYYNQYGEYQRYNATDLAGDLYHEGRTVEYNQNVEHEKQVAYEGQSHWEEIYDSSGRLYYYNRETGETRWA